MNPHPLSQVFLRLFWTWFLLPILVLTILAIGATGYLGGQAFEDQQTRLNAAMAYNVTNYLDSTKRMLESLAAYGASSSLEDFSLALEMQQKGYQNFDTLFLLDSSGRVRVTFPRDERYNRLDLSGQRYFQEALHSDRVYTSPPFMSLRTGYPAVFLAIRVERQGVLVGELSLSELQTIISTNPNLPWQSTVFVTDPYGALLAHPDFRRVAQQENVGRMEIIRQVDDDGVTRMYFEDGRFYVGRASRIQPDGWIIVTQTLFTEIYGPYYIAALLLVLVYVVTLALFSRRLIQQFNRRLLLPITQLSKLSSSIASGEYDKNAHDVTTIPVTFHELDTLVSNFTRMSQAVAAREQELAYMASHDYLTRLPNRPLFQKRLAETIERAAPRQENFALLFVDLDNFKTINDAFGHQKGDHILRVVADLLIEAAPPSAFVGRLGGDEFGILLPEMRYARDAAALSEKILARFNLPIQLQNAQVYISASIGISFFPVDGTEPDSLIQNADTAMYSAKREGKNTYQFFHLELQTQAQERHLLSAHLHHALELQELRLVYQPIYSAAEHRPAKCEALARWKNPRLGEIAPEQFIALANETGLILPIGEWILRTACAQARPGWMKATPCPSA